MDIDLQSSPVGFTERYVFSENREEVLKELVEGSEDYFKYKLLNINSKIENEIIMKDEKKRIEIIEEMIYLHNELREHPKLKNNGDLKNLMVRNEMHFLHLKKDIMMDGSSGSSGSNVDVSKLWEYIRSYTGYPTHMKPVKKTLSGSSSSSSPISSSLVDYNVDDKKGGGGGGLLSSLFGSSSSSSSSSSRTIIDGNSFVKDKLKQSFDSFLDKYDSGSPISSYLNPRAIMEWLCTSTIMNPILEEIKNKNTTDKNKQKKYRQLIIDVLNNSSSIYCNDIISELIVIDFNYKDPNNNDVKFGNRHIHHQLTLNRLNDLLNACPQLSDDTAFLQAYFSKSLPMECMSYYQQSALDADELPPQVLELFHRSILTFMKKFLTHPRHSTLRAVLLLYLIRCQFDQDGTFNPKYVMEYLRIPKESGYNNGIVSMYRECVRRYEDETMKRKTVDSATTRETDVSTSQKDRPRPVMIGFGDFISKYQTFDRFPSIGNDESIIDNAIRYFFQNPDKMHEGLPNDLLKQIHDDQERLKVLEAMTEEDKVQQKVNSQARKSGLNSVVTKISSYLKSDKKTEAKLKSKPTPKSVKKEMPAKKVAQKVKAKKQKVYKEEEEDDDDDDYNTRRNISDEESDGPDEAEEDIKKRAFIDASSKNIVEMFRPYIDKERLRRMQAEHELSRGKEETINLAYRILSEMMGDAYLKNLREEIVLEFEKSNPTQIGVKDGVTLKLRAKNIKNILIKVYRMNSMNYMKKRLGEVASDLNLEGLKSSFEDKEITIDQEKSPYAVQYLQVDLVETLKNQRGLFFIDCIGNGKHCRALIRKGDIKFVERKSSSGHIFTLLDECNNTLVNGGIILDGQRYESIDKSGEIFVPFDTKSGSSRSKKIILYNKEWSEECSVLGEFEHAVETYDLRTCLWMEREQILDKNTCHVFIRCVLKANGIVTSIEKLLRNASLEVSMHTLSGERVKVNRLFDNLEMSDSKDCIVKFIIPSECHRIDLTFKAQIKKLNDTYQDTIKIKTYEMNAMNKTSDIACAHLIPISVNNKKNEYQIMICGKNGEPLKRVKCNVSLKHLYTSDYSFDCLSDDKGLITLTNMFGITDIQVTVASINRGQRWAVGTWKQSIFHTKHHILEGEKLYIPYYLDGSRPDHIDDFILTDPWYANDYSDKVSYTDGYIIVDKLKAGSYKLRCDYDRCNISIHVCERAPQTTLIECSNKTQVCLEDSNLFELSEKQSLQIRRCEEQKDYVRVYLSGVNQWTRAHIIFTHLIPSFPVFNELAEFGILECANGEYHSAPSMFCKGREISEEYRYVLERANAHKYIGNNLQKPSLLIRPFSNKTTTTETQDAKTGETIEHKKYKQRRQVNAGGQTQTIYSQITSNGNWPVLEFLGTCPALSWYNLSCKQDKNNGEYYVEINKKELNENHHVMTVVGVNDKYFSVYTHVLQHTKPLSETKYRDVRMYPGLNPQKHFVEQRQIEMLRDPKTEKVVVEDFKTSQAEIFESTEHIFNLYRSLSKNNNLVEWSFLYQWNTLKEEEKLKKFNKYLSHEFNFFIYCKDREFFNEFIKPLIVSKVQKTLLDYWFLGDLTNLRPYLDIGIFMKLNALEQILLCYAFKNEMKEKFQKFFNEKQNSIKLDPYQFKTLFESALAERNFADVQPVAGDIRFLNNAVPITMTSTSVLRTEAYALYDRAFAPRIPIVQKESVMRNASVCDVDMDLMLDMKVDIAARDFDNLSVASVEMDFAQEKKKNYNKNMQQQQQLQQERLQIYPQSIQKENKKEKNNGEYFDRDLRYREIGRKYYEELQNTKQFQETQYYGIGYDKDTGYLIPLNQYWCDYALHILSSDEKSKQSFVSQYFSLATSSLTEMLFAMAVLDVPLQTNGDSVRRDKNFVTMQMTIQSDHPCIVLSKQLRETDQVSVRVQVSQHYFDPEDRYEMFDGEQTDKFVNADKMLPSKMYGCRAIITNASSAQIRNVEVLYQIPVGSIPLNNGKWTHTQFETIPSYSSKIIEFYFYFPTVGKYTHFPVQISKNGQILGHSSNNPTINVSIPNQAVKIDEDNWMEVSLSEDVKTVIKYLEKHNLYETDLSRIYYMLNHANNFLAIVELLESRRYYDNEIWRYSVLHQNTKYLAQYLQCNAHILRHLFAPYFKSEWNYIYDDQSLGNRAGTHLEYFPLINARSHKLGTKKKILNASLLRTYTSYLNRMCYLSLSVRDIPWVDMLKGCYYLILQDRMNESQFLFNELIEKEKGPLKQKYAIQYDYMKAYLSLIDEKDETCEIAQKICKKYTSLKKLPINKQRIFEDMDRQLNEMHNIPSDEIKKNESDGIDDILGERERRLERQALTEPSIDFVIENRQLVFQYFKIENVRVNFYEMDIELLFSMSPFLSRGQMDTSQNVFSFIQPNETLNVKLPVQDTNLPKSYSVDIPKSLLHCNIYCEVIVTNPSTYSNNNPLSQTFYDHRLLVQVKQKYGQIKVLDKETKTPLQKCYVKVYARVNGTPKFHKDGYTDRRGVFDYVSVSCNHLTNTDKFAILVYSQKFGAVVQTADSPQ